MPEQVARSAGGRVGSFRYWFDTDIWEWSDEVAAMHGYRPGEIIPTTELLRGHKHPDDQAAFDALVRQMRATRTHFSSRHRIVDTAGRIRAVSVLGRTFAGPDGSVAGSEGYYLDLGNPDEAEVVREQVREHVTQFRRNHAPIEQAKGMLMLIYGIDHERAFDVLRWRSQQENRKLHVVARAIIAAAAGRIAVPDGLRREFDLVVLAPFSDN